MNLRAAVTSDIPQMVKMRLEYLTEDHGGMLPEHRDRLQKDLPDYFNKNLKGSLLAYVAEHRGVIVSTVFMVITEKPGNPHFLSGKTGLLLNVYTKSEYRRQGIAGGLINMAIEDAKKLDLAHIELSATASGYPLYKKLGFIEEHPHYASMKYQIQL
ncbi:MAG: acetyltransferase [Herbinix sp.]|jgi:ribosomal protein S18 acetylase RimI-like enzyme|nr:acetyltransferase [Herbinix sp.]